jgi:hypothetical protein
VKMRGRALVGICFWGGVFEGVVGEIGEGRGLMVGTRPALPTGSSAMGGVSEPRGGRCGVEGRRRFPSEPAGRCGG